MADSIVRKENKFAKTLAGAALVGLVAIMLFAVIGSYIFWIKGAGSHRTKIEGRVVDKQMMRQESRYGAAIERRLIVEEKDGKRSQVFVSEKLFEQAQIGTQFRRVAGVDSIDRLTTPSPTNR